MTKKRLLEEVSFDKIRPYIQGKDILRKGDTIPDKDIDYVTSAVIHRVRKIIRASK